MQQEIPSGQDTLTVREIRTCPVCGGSSLDADLFLEEKVDLTKLNQFSFASRKEPEYFNYRMVRCKVCDLVYVDRPPSQQALAQAYHSADYDSAEEAEDAAGAYLREMKAVLGRVHPGAALEIGTGTGVLLDGLMAAGFSRVQGVEPSSAAIAAAPSHRRPWITEGIFNERDYQPESFDLICCFMTLEHVRDPMDIVKSALHLLRPGGAFVSVTHDYSAPLNRALGRRSPIIDVEHMQLFSRRSIEELLSRAGYVDIDVKPFSNRYALSYWMRLVPAPASLKRSAITAMNALGVGRLKLSANVGNTMAVAYRPVADRGRGG